MPDTNNDNFKEALRKLVQERADAIARIREASDAIREQEQAQCDCPDCTQARELNLQPYNPFILEITRR